MISTSAMNQFREFFIFASRSLHTITISPGTISINLIVLTCSVLLDSSTLCNFFQSGWSLDLSGRRDNAVPPALFSVMARIFEFLKSSCAYFLELLALSFLPLALSRFYALPAHLCGAVTSFAPFRVFFCSLSLCAESGLRIKRLSLPDWMMSGLAVAKCFYL